MTPAAGASESAVIFSVQGNLGGGERGGRAVGIAHRIAVTRGRLVWTCGLLALAGTVVFVALNLTGVWAHGDDLWTDLRAEITSSDVASVELVAGPKRSVLSPTDSRPVMEAFVAGEFDEDNPHDFGPTAEVAVLITLGDGRVVAANQWPDGRFEMLAHERQFLVRSPRLEALLRDLGLVYSN